MFKRLTKTIGLFLFLLFVCGSVLVPVFHKAHCDDQAAAGGDTHCAICHVINTPCIISYLPVTIIVEHFLVGTVQLENSLFVAATLCYSCQARAPPVV